MSKRTITLPQAEPWYAPGLKFTCTQCGNCCTGGPGYVWITPEEVTRLAAYLKQSESDVIEQYCRKVGSKLSLKEVRTKQGEYDCIFLKEQPVKKRADGGPVFGKRICTIYSVRPVQCRTWPFWKGNLSSPETWSLAGERCPGMNQGQHYTQEQIEETRDRK